MPSQSVRHIVDFASRHGVVPSPILGAYPPARSAVTTLPELLDAERQAPVGVTVLTPSSAAPARSVAV